MIGRLPTVIQSLESKKETGFDSSRRRHYVFPLCIAIRAKSAQVGSDSEAIRDKHFVESTSKHVSASIRYSESII
jgi:hypothetical protein